MEHTRTHKHQHSHAFTHTIFVHFNRNVYLRLRSLLQTVQIYSIALWYFVDENKTKKSMMVVSIRWCVRTCHRMHFTFEVRWFETVYAAKWQFKCSTENHSHTKLNCI